MPKMTVDQKVIRELAALLDETGLTEIEWEEGGQRIRVTRAAAQVMAYAQQPAAAPVAASITAAPVSNDLSKHPGAVTSPMVGTAYITPEPGAKPFVQLGDTVKEGQILLIIEAMKTMNPIPATRAGRITQILISGGTPVEFGEVLMVIE
jgi:acetyl-CoA carboxylase biotin carboxyl carrier protein